MSTKPQQFRAGAYYLGATFIESMVPLITLPIFMRVLLPEDFGALALAQIYGVIVGSLASFGMASGYNRYYFEYCEDLRKTGQLFFTTIGFVFVLSIVILLLTLIFQSSLGKIILQSDNRSELLIWALAGTLLINLRLFFLTYLRNVERPKQYVMNTVVFGFMNLFFSIYFVIVGKAGVIGVLYGQVLASSLILLALLVQFFRELPVAWSTPMLKAALRIGGPTVPATLFGFLSNHIDKYLIVLMSGVGDVGIYSIGQKIAGLILTFMTSLQNVFTPGIYQRMFANKGGSSAEISKYLLPYIYVLVLFALMLALFSEEIVTFFVPAQFYGTIDIIIVFSLFYAILIFAKVSGEQLVFVKQTYLLTVVVIGTGLFNTLLNIPFILKWGAVGAATATLFSRIIAVAVIVILAQKYYKILWQTRTIASIYSLLFFSAGGLCLLRLFDIDYPLRLIFKLLMVVVYIQLAFRIGLINNQDWQGVFKKLSGLLKKRKL